jgi:PPM family protein phosphatase
MSLGSSSNDDKPETAAPARKAAVEAESPASELPAEPKAQASDLDLGSMSVSPANDDLELPVEPQNLENRVPALELQALQSVGVIESLPVLDVPEAPASPIAPEELLPPEPEPEAAPPPIAEVPPPAAPAPPSLPATIACPCCQADVKTPPTFCGDCGYMFPDNYVVAPSVGAANSSSSAAPAMPSISKVRIKDRYELHEMIGELFGVRRYRGLDLGNGRAIPVEIVTASSADLAIEAVEDTAVAAEVVEDDIMPGFDDVLLGAAVEPGAAAWPSLAWEKAILEKANHPGLPVVVDHFIDGTTEYLIEEAPQGRSLWDAWDEPAAVADVRYAWLQQAATALHALAQAGAIIEGVRPDIIVVAESGQARLTSVADLLPIPLPPGAPIRATLYTAPELILNPEKADGRSNLYSLGATLYALEYLHHGLEEKDFERQYVPRQITDRFPDVHPLFPRLINKTFVRMPEMRFPSDEMTKTDPTGIKEMIRTMDVCRKTFDRVRLDIAAWTTTGMVRTGNEDAFALLHGVEARQDDVYEYSMVLLCDGMGGYEAGEVAAAMAIAKLREYLLQQPLFAALTGKAPPPMAGSDQLPAYKDVLQAALRHANKEVYSFSRAPGKPRRTMGCTAEAIYIDSGNIIVGHVGDSRTYHLHEGRLVQLTRDQTLVNRLVELGQITEEEAENHDRKNELQQAIGAQPDVVPGLYHGKLKRGDWVLVCSDGLTNHINNAELEKMLTREAAGSAEEAARRLLNLVNLRGATDNATIVVVRAT